MENVTNGLGFSGGDQKSAIMNQVRQEAAMTNARQLIEACLFLFANFYYPFLTLELESQRALLREVRSKTGVFVVERRDLLLHIVHGEVHGDMEYG
jgi:hypothetical protein